MTTTQPTTHELIPALRLVPALIEAVRANEDPTVPAMRVREAMGNLTPADIEDDIRARLRRDALLEAADLIEFTWAEYADSDVIRSAHKFARTLRREALA